MAFACGALPTLIMRAVPASETAAANSLTERLVRRDPATRGFTILPRRWTVERTLGWLMNHRRLARDYETLTVRSAKEERWGSLGCTRSHARVSALP